VPANDASQHPRHGDLAGRAVATDLPDSVTDPDAADRIRAFYAKVAIPAGSIARAAAFAMS
jgi:hypothetical protein